MKRRKLDYCLFISMMIKTFMNENVNIMNFPATFVGSNLLACWPLSISFLLRPGSCPVASSAASLHLTLAETRFQKTAMNSRENYHVT